jgi:hypothetical protein
MTNEQECIILVENNYNAKVNEMPTFEEYAAACEAAHVAQVGEDFDENFSSPALAKKARMMNYKTEYLMELAIREGNAKAAEEEAERLTREYNEKMAALGVKHKIETSDSDKALLSILRAWSEDADGNGNASVRF